MKHETEFELQCYYIWAFMALIY